jgi:DNA modification methylase
MDNLFDSQPKSSSFQPVECLGLTFPNNEERRKYFLEKLSEKLKDPEFRKIEGFPIGADEDILALSDPPYHTACPNPFMTDFIKHYGKPYEPTSDNYRCEPFSADVSEGKGDTIYSAHSYHTKVPPQAIARYILHYTEPGDLVLDPFAGSGMTGVASILCNSRSFVVPDHLGHIRRGQRIPVLCDLSPAATFISAVYLNPPASKPFAAAARRILDETVTEVRSDWAVNGRIVDYFVIAEVLLCPNCQSEIATDQVVKMTDSIGSASAFDCPECRARVSKAPTKESGATRLERVLATTYDQSLGRLVPLRKERIISLQYKDGQQPLFATIQPDRRSERLSQIAEQWAPTDELIQGDRNLIKDCCASYGITHIHHFYTARQLRYFSSLWRRALLEKEPNIRHALQFFIQSYSLGATRLNRFIPAPKGKSSPGSQVNRYFSGTLYVPSLMSEVSPDYLYRKKIERLVRAFELIGAHFERRHAIGTQDAGAMSLPSNSIDYIFVDPPFGKNLQYSELNQLWEAWLRVKTDRDPEAVVDETRGRDVFEYGKLMKSAFAMMYRVLKPGRWITLEFHNSFNAVWTAIQEGLFATGFIVADVRVLDKQQDTYKQSRQGLVKQDLVISAYKPNGGLEDRFKLAAGTDGGVWDFVRTHLKQLPVFVSKDGQAEVIAERQNYLLFDRMVAFHVQRGVTVPLSAAEFYAGLEQRFSSRDGMYFLPDQIAEYDRKRIAVGPALQIELFVIDEASAIQWLRQQLTRKPQTAGELKPQFMQEIGGWQKTEKLLELDELLEQNFLRYEGKGEVPSQIHSYLSTNFKELRNLPKDDENLRSKGKDRWYVPDPNKAADLERLRDKALLREFWDYLPSDHQPAKPASQESYIPGLEPKPGPIPKGKKMKVIRLEAVRAGFRYCWQNRDYRTIIAVAQRIPESVLQEDPKLLMWYDQALTRTGEDQ